MERHCSEEQGGQKNQFHRVRHSSTESGGQAKRRVTRCGKSSFLHSVDKAPRKIFSRKVKNRLRAVARFP